MSTVFFKKAVRLISVLIAAVLFIPGCGVSLKIPGAAEEPVEVTGADIGKVLEASVSEDGIFALNYSSTDTVNPYTSESARNLLFATLIYETLVVLDEHYEPVPNLATEWNTEDGKAYLITVDTSVKMHDGTNLTAHDVAYSIIRAMFGAAYKARFSDVIGVGAISDEVVEINLARVNYRFPALLNVPVIKNNSVSENSPPGTGPFIFDAIRRRLAAFSGHRDYAELPVKEIYLKEYNRPEDIIIAFEDNEIDLVTNDPTSLSSLGYSGANEIRYYQTTSMHYLGFNYESPFMSAPARRACVTYAINRSHIVTNIFGGCMTAAVLPMSPLYSQYNQSFADYFDYSPERCDEVLNLAEVLIGDAETGARQYLYYGEITDAEISFIVNNESAAKVAAARDIARNLEEAGLTVNLRELSWRDYTTALNSGDFDIYYGEVKLTPDFDLRALLGKNGELNYGNIPDQMFSTVIEEYLAAPDEQLALYTDMMLQQIMSMSPIAVIGFKKLEVITHRGIVTGMSPTQYDIFNNFAGWSINIGS